MPSFALPGPDLTHRTPLDIRPQTGTVNYSRKLPFTRTLELPPPSVEMQLKGWRFPLHLVPPHRCVLQVRPFSSPTLNRSSPTLRRFSLPCYGSLLTYVSPPVSALPDFLRPPPNSSSRSAMHASSPSTVRLLELQGKASQLACPLDPQYLHRTTSPPQPERLN